MTAMNLDFIVETMSGSSEDSIYAVVAKTQNYVLGIRPLVFGIGQEDSSGTLQPVIHLGARLRAQPLDPKKALTVEQAEAEFALLGFYQKSKKHVSQVIGVPLGSSYSLAAASIRDRWIEVNPALRMAEAIYEQLGKKNIEPVLTKTRLASWLDLEYDKAFAVIAPIEVDHTVVFGLNMNI